MKIYYKPGDGAAIFKAYNPIMPLWEQHRQLEVENKKYATKPAKLVYKVTVNHVHALWKNNPDSLDFIMQSLRETPTTLVQLHKLKKSL